MYNYRLSYLIQHIVHKCDIHVGCMGTSVEMCRLMPGNISTASVTEIIHTTTGCVCQHARCFTSSEYFLSETTEITEKINCSVGETCHFKEASSVRNGRMFQRDNFSKTGIFQYESKDVVPEIAPG